MRKVTNETGKFLELPVRELLGLAQRDRDFLFRLKLLDVAASLLQRLKELPLAQAFGEVNILCLLLELKSKLLLPSEEEVEVKSEEPQASSVSEKLKLYDQLRRQVNVLSERLKAQSKLLGPLSHDERVGEKYYALKDVSLYDLITAFEDILSRLEKISVITVQDEDYSFEKAYEEVLSAISRSGGEATLSSILTLRAGVSWVIVSFLVVLELITSGQLSFSAKQGEILLSRLPRAA